MRDKRGNPTIVLLAVTAIVGLLFIGFFRRDEVSEENNDIIYSDSSSDSQTGNDGQNNDSGDSLDETAQSNVEDNLTLTTGSEALATEEPGAESSSDIPESPSADGVENYNNSTNQNRSHSIDSRGPAHSDIPLDTYSVVDDDSEGSNLSIWELAKHDGYPDMSVYGINYYVPAGFVYLEPENPPPIGHNYLLYNPNLDMTIYIWEAFEHQFPDGVHLDNVIEDTYAEASLDDSVTYKRKGDHWCVVSGTEDNGKTIFYNKTIIIEFDYEEEWDRDGLEGWCNITYPSANQNLCASAVEQFENSFRPSNYSA